MGTTTYTSQYTGAQIDESVRQWNGQTVNINNPAQGQVLGYNGSEWINIASGIPNSLPAIGRKWTGRLLTSGWNTDTTFFNGKVNALGGQRIQIAMLSDYKVNNLYSLPTKSPIYATLAGYSGEKTFAFSSITDGLITYSSTFDGGTDYIEIDCSDIPLFKGGVVLRLSDYHSVRGNVILKDADIAKPKYSISSSAIKTNSFVEMFLSNAEEVRPYSKTDGSIVVEMDNVPTTTIQYDCQIVETSTAGAFEITNSHVPSVPIILQFTNIAVASTAFAADTTYTDYGYKGTIALTGVTTSMLAEIIFGVAEAVSGNYAPVCETYAGGVYIYSKVNTAITIPSIQATEA